MGEATRTAPIGIVGLGRLGLPIASRLLAAGHEVHGCDVSGPANAAASAAGVVVHGSPRELAGPTRASLVLVGDDDDVLDACLRGDDALLAGMSEGDAIIVSATVLPGTVQEVAQAAQARGVDVLDAPLARGEQAIEQGRALVLGGGRPEPFERWRPVLQVFSSEVTYLGDVGAGQVGKMVNNLLLWSTIAADYEGLRLAQRFGVDLDALREGLLLGSGRNWALDTWDWPRDMPWAAKDMEIVLRSCDDHGLAAPVARSVQEAIATIRSEKLAWQADRGRTTSMGEFIAGSEGAERARPQRRRP